MTSKLKCPKDLLLTKEVKEKQMKAYEATLTIDGKWLMTLTAPNIEMALDGLRAEMYNTAKNIKIEVKEI